MNNLILEATGRRWEVSLIPRPHRPGNEVSQVEVREEGSEGIILPHTVRLAPFPGGLGTRPGGNGQSINSFSLSILPLSVSLRQQSLTSLSSSDSDSFITPRVINS